MSLILIHLAIRVYRNGILAADKRTHKGRYIIVVDAVCLHEWIACIVGVFVLNRNIGLDVVVALPCRIYYIEWKTD